MISALDMGSAEKETAGSRRFLYRTVSFFQDNNETDVSRKCPAQKEKAALRRFPADN
jgi:hypothetical protein